MLALLLVSGGALAESTSSEDNTPALDYYGQEMLTDPNYLADDIPVLDEFGAYPAAPATPKPQVAISTTPTNDLWQRIRGGFGMANLQSPYTSTHEAWYAARPEYVQRMVGRSQLYLYHIVEEVQKRGMPTEIALLPMIESAFQPGARSSAKAVGIWQFIPSTGKHFGLKQDWWTDNRRDVTAATDAALNYLEKLHVMFGTWELALAAYNAGEGTVQRAIERNRRKGLPTDYQSLQLPTETKEYVPKLQAVKNIVTNPEQYGLQIKTIANQPYFTAVSAPSKIDVKLAAKLAGVSMAEFTQLNPAHNRPVMSNNSGNQNILLPVGKEQEFASNLASYDKSLVSWQTYHARRGEPLSKVAKKYGVSVAELREVNDLSAKARLKSNQPLLVPTSDGNKQDLVLETPIASEDEAQTTKAEDKPAATQYLVKKGDTAFKIAKRYHMTTKQLLALNGLKSAKLSHGQSLVVGNAPTVKVAAKAATKSSKKLAKAGKTRYVVKRGETLASIADKFNVAINDLQRWNKIQGSRILPGLKLTIYKPDAA
ncbi:MAG: LysM peptidoglycan-binding domain-containing protein [Methylophilaceae bacterium]